MPINRKMMNSLRKEYGDKAKDIYYAIENKQKQPKKKKRNALAM